MQTLTQSTTKASRSTNIAKSLTAQEMAIYSRIPAQIGYVAHSSFASPATEDSLFGPDAPVVAIPTWNACLADDEKAPSGSIRKLSTADEVRLFLQYNYARFRLAKLIAMQNRSPRAARAKQMILWYTRAMQARENLVQANMALVVSMASRSHVGNEDPNELISEGNMALLRSVEKFDVSRGFKFSTYACRSILKGFNRMATTLGRYHQRFPVEFDPEMETSDNDDRRHRQQWQDSIDAVMEILMRNRADLTGVERTVVLQRFSIPSGGKKRTLSQVGMAVGLTNERVRQIQKTAIAKIRQTLFERYLTH